MRRIEEIFVPASVTTPEQLIAFLRELIIARGGDPADIKLLDTESAIPNVKHDDAWPCLTIAYRGHR